MADWNKPRQIFLSADELSTITAALDFVSYHVNGVNKVKTERLAENLFIRFFDSAEDL